MEDELKPPGPDYVILDISSVRDKFFDSIKGMTYCEADLTEVMCLLPCYVNDRLSCYDGLQAMIDQSLEDHRVADAFDDGLLMAKGIEIMGYFLVDTYKELGMYHENNVCYYVFDSWVDDESAVFKKESYETLFE